MNNNKNTKRTKSVDLKSVIRQRLDLPTVKNKLYYDFGLINTDYTYLTNPVFLKHALNKWDENRKNEFLILLGGPVNKHLTFNFVNSLVQESKNI